MESLGGDMKIQEAMRLGTSQDVYYYTSSSMHKQSIPTLVNNRFFQDLTSKIGSSSFIISPNEGLTDVILGAVLPVQGVAGVDYTGLALPRGYLYKAINRISVRYAGSSTYFQTGDQIMIQNLREASNPSTKDAMFELGGAPMVLLSEFAGSNLESYAYINLPHNSPQCGTERVLPFPSELLNSPIVITIELNPLQSLFSSNDGDLTGAPTQFDQIYFQVKQVNAVDRGQLMKMGEGKAYSFPLKAFYQQEVIVRVGSRQTVPTVGKVPYNVQLTGFRNGEVRSIFFWITRDKDTDPAPAAAGVPVVKNFTNFVLPTDVQLQYNGSVYYRARGAASQMFSLLNSDIPATLNCTALSVAGTVGAYTLAKTGVLANWTDIQFSQVFEKLSGSSMYISGLPIRSSVVSLDLSLPDNDAYTLHFVYSYNAVMMLSGGSAEFVF